MSLLCRKCKRTFEEKQFYATRRTDRFPTGFLSECKKCRTMHVNNWEPETFKPILEEIDIPYVEHEWKKLLDKYGQNPEKITGMTIIGRYISKMRLVQYKNDRWADSDRLNEEYRKKQIEAIEQDENITEEEKEEVLNAGLGPPPPQASNVSSGGEFPQDDFGFSEEDIILGNDLTEDDKKYLLIKWGKYRPSEWVRLEQLYQDMIASYDIQAAGHQDTLKLVCKASLKSNQLMDIGDIDGAQKAVKMYDTLMKSGKFTAQQNKAETGEAIDSVGEMALLCEKEGGFIPVYYDGKPKDCVDKTLEDLKRYTYNLVVNEQGLGDLIEQAMKAMQKDSEKEDLEDEDEEEIILEDVDFIEHSEFLEKQRELDSEDEQ